MPIVTVAMYSSSRTQREKPYC